MEKLSSCLNYEWNCSQHTWHDDQEQGKERVVLLLGK